MSQFRAGDYVRVVNAPDPDLNGMTGYIRSRHVAPFDYNVSVGVAGFMGEEAPFRASELELISPPADEDCERCHGSGIDPDSEPMYHPGAPGIPDPASWEPCECILRQLEERGEASR